METIVGIDLGTTNSTITAIDENGKTHFIKNSFGEYITPSAVYFNDDKSVLIGKKAKEKSNTDPDNLVMYVKREMGKQKEKVREDRTEGTFHPYIFGNRVFSPEEISAFILRQLKSDAEKELGHPVKKAVITCPAYFGDAEKNATKLAGKYADLDVLEIIPEPTAAALSYSAVSKKNETLLVFDLGGGTFDVTIMKTSDSNEGRKVEMLATDGNHRLGGIDWDGMIIDFMFDRFNKRFNIDLDYEPEKELAKTYGKLRIEVEKAKVALFKENVESVPLAIEYGGKKHVEEISRSLYAAKTEKLTSSCKTYCMNTLNAAGLNWSDIDTVLMIGNMSNCETIQTELKKWSGKEIQFGIINPKTCVSEGAAIKGFLLEGGDRVKKLLRVDKDTAAFDQTKEITERVQKLDEQGERTDTKFDRNEIKSGVLPSAIGIKVLKKDGSDFYKKLLEKNSPYPESQTKTYPLFKDGDFNLVVLEGDSDIITECKKLGSINVILDGKMKKGDKLSITLSIDNNGILQVEAQNTELGIHLKSKISRENDVPDEDVKRIIEENEEFFLG